MELDFFNALSKKAQQEMLLAQGTFLAERKDGPFRIMLYQLESFYVEVHFFNLYNKVAFFSAFETLDALEPYLETIDVTEMLQEALS
ncbi:MAG TPA: hypothetical protein VM010_05790 [Chitinophagaceae bacterium]|nr:hypothetical protein [Chitinophagaceae bacterium]